MSIPDSAFMRSRPVSPASPLVTVIIPSYNHAQYIGQAIESVLDQTYPNIQLLVVDDGSSDSSHDVIKRYALDPRVTAILNRENRGQSHAINSALEVARGSFVSLLPSDDWYLPDKTEKQLKKFADSSDRVGAVYGKGLRYFEQTGETKDVSLPVFTGQIAKNLIEWGNFVYPVTPMFRRECFDVVKLDESFKAEGEAFYLRLALKYEFEYVNEVVAVMRDHEYNIGKDVSLMYDEVLRYWNHFFDRPDIPDHIRKLRSIPIARLHRTKAMQFIGEQRNLKMGRTCLLRALREQPKQVMQPRFLAALALCCLPLPLANLLIDAYKAPT